MSVPNDIQEKVAKALVEHPGIDRSENRMLADGSLEVWLYDYEGVLRSVATVFTSGSYAIRPPSTAT